MSTEEYMRANPDDIDWSTIASRKHLSEEFIREFQDKVNWFSIGFYLTLSEEFIIEFIDKLDIDYILKYQDLDPEVKEYLTLLKG